MEIIKTDDGNIIQRTVTETEISIQEIELQITQLQKLIDTYKNENNDLSLSLKTIKNELIIKIVQEKIQENINLIL
jgi:conjugal transfer/entry exclusion protein